MDMHFIPATPKGELRLLEEALGMAINGHPVLGMSPYEDEVGRTIERFRVGRDLITIDWPPAMWRARDSIRSALKDAQIEVLVQNRQTSDLYRVPRTYWFRHDLGTSVLELNHDDPGYSPHLDAQPLIVDMSQQERWVESRLSGPEARA